MWDYTCAKIYFWLLGECYSELDHFEKALKHQNLHLELAKACSDGTEEQRAWATIGMISVYAQHGIKATYNKYKIDII